jgi:hypothetical protein
MTTQLQTQTEQLPSTSTLANRIPFATLFSFLSTGASNPAHFYSYEVLTADNYTPCRYCIDFPILEPMQANPNEVFFISEMYYNSIALPLARMYFEAQGTTGSNAICERIDLMLEAREKFSLHAFDSNEVEGIANAKPFLQQYNAEALALWLDVDRFDVLADATDVIAKAQERYNILPGFDVSSDMPGAMQAITIAKYIECRKAIASL